MRTEIDQGGPAFPRIEPEIGGCGPNVYFGMTLRDYFAAKAMQGMLARPHSKPTVVTGMTCEVRSAEHYALRAYEFADAMLKARRA